MSKTEQCNLERKEDLRSDQTGEPQVERINTFIQNWKYITMFTIIFRSNRGLKNNLVKFPNNEIQRNIRHFDTEERKPCLQHFL